MNANERVIKAANEFRSATQDVNNQQTKLNELQDRSILKQLLGGESTPKDTFGFPIDLTQLIAEEKGWTIDLGSPYRLPCQRR